MRPSSRVTDSTEGLGARPDGLPRAGAVAVPCRAVPPGGALRSAPRSPGGGRGAAAGAEGRAAAQPRAASPLWLLEARRRAWRGVLGALRSAPRCAEELRSEGCPVFQRSDSERGVSPKLAVRPV